MAEPTTIDNRTLLRRTLATAGAMVGACVFLVGTLSLIASAIVDHSVEAKNAADAGGAANARPTPSAPNRGAGTPAMSGK